jgi:hypothetical protein
MGLAERRQIARVDDGLEEVVADLRQHLGAAIEMEIDKTSFPENKAVLDGYGYYKDYGFPMLARVLKRIACDDLGREAVNDKIRKVRLVNTGVDESNGGEKSVTLNDGVLTVNQGWYSYSDKLYGEDTLVQQIEAML